MDNKNIELYKRRLKIDELLKLIDDLNLRTHNLGFDLGQLRKGMSVLGLQLSLNPRDQRFIEALSQLLMVSNAKERQGTLGDFLIDNFCRIRQSIKLDLLVLDRYVSVTSEEAQNWLTEIEKNISKETESNITNPSEPSENQD